MTDHNVRTCADALSDAVMAADFRLSDLSRLRRFLLDSRAMLHRGIVPDVPIDFPPAVRDALREFLTAACLYYGPSPTTNH